MDSEREVILEEIAMYEDDPQDKVFDVLGRAVFGDHPLGRAIIGHREVVAGTPRDAVAAFHAERYVPENVVIAAAGSVDHDALVELASARVPATPGGFAGDGDDPVALPRAVFEPKETEQYHVCLGGGGLARDDERRFTGRVLDTLLGGASSSRLFQEVREKRGLAYAVYSFLAHFRGAGQTGAYVGTRADNLEAALRVLADEVERVRREPPSAAEVERAKENVKGRIVLSLESTGARMNRLGSSLLADLPLFSIDEAVAKIDAVTAEGVAELARELWAPERLSLAGIGPDEELFRRAAAPLAGAGAAVS